MDAEAGRLSLVAEVANTIRDLILNGELEPGQHVVENRLTQRLSVSQGTVRAALRLLVNEGIVEELPRRGCFIKVLTGTDVREIYTLRNALEALAASEAARRMTAQGRRSLDKVMKAMAAAYDKGDFLRFIELDFEFHRIIVEESGHERLKANYHGLATQTRLFMRMVADDLPDEIYDGLMEMHAALGRAIIEGRSELAATLASTHNNRTGPALEALLDSQNFASVRKKRPQA